MKYEYAGVSTLNGKTKVRWANDAARVKVLAKNGHYDIDMVPLKYPMTKSEAVEYLLDIDFDNGNAAIRQVLTDELVKRSETVKPQAQLEEEVA